MKPLEISHTDPTQLTVKDLKSDQEVRWCPGCGDYSILAQVQRTLPGLQIPRENFVFVGGIGCAARFPYYMETYGIHGIHGRAPAIATGIKAVRPDLTVFVITGDGDGLSIGGNHLLHVLRRNVDLNILLFNNRIYGLTKGQYSPTSLPGTRSKSSPTGSVDYPVEPVRFALGAGAGFVARTVDVDAKHFQATLKRAAAHRGATFLEIFQNCPIFNDGAYVQLQDKKQRPQHILYLEHGKPLLFGPEGEQRGIAMNAKLEPEVVRADDDRVLVHDETNEMMALLLSRMDSTVDPSLPTPVGVFRAVDRPTYEAMLGEQVEAAKDRQGGKTLQDLLESGETWTVSPGGAAE